MSRLTRRSFLGKTAAVAAVATSLPHIAKAEKPNDKIGVAVVGVRSRGTSHIGGYLSDPRSHILYVVDVDENFGQKRAAEIEAKQGFKPKWVRDMRDAIADKSVDVLSVATPNHWHALAGIWAMQAGKDAYIEKPVCQTIAEGTALIAASRKYDRMCQVGTQCRSSAAVQNALKFMSGGGIGEVNFARGLCYKRRKSINPLGNYDVPSGLDFDLWSGPPPETDPKVTRKQFHYDWHWQRMYGNGDLGNQGPHQTDIARWGLGIDSHPNSVVSYGGRLGYQAERNDANYVDAGDTANTEVTIYNYGDKCIVFETRGLSVNDSSDEELNRLFQSTSGNKIGVVFYGSEGYLVQRTYTHCIAYDKKFNVIKEFKGGGNHFSNFLDAVESRDRSKLNADVREGHLSAGLSHLGNISYYVGEKNFVPQSEAEKLIAEVPSLDDNVATLKRTFKHLTDNGVELEKYPVSMGPHLQFNPETEVFPDSPEATSMVTREYRQGFECPTASDV